MYFLYGHKKNNIKLVATFSSEQQLLAYVRWATLSDNPVFKFEQGSPLVSYNYWSHSVDDPSSVVHNPTPSML